MRVIRRGIPEYDLRITISISALDLAHLKPKKKLSPRERDSALAQAREYWDKGQKEEAWEIIQNQGLFRCRTLPVRRFLAQVYMEKGLAKRCLQQTSILIRKDKSLEVSYLHATSLRDLGRNQEALRFLTPLIREPGPQATPLELRFYLLYFLALFDHSRKEAMSIFSKVEKVIDEAERRGQEELLAEATFSLGTSLRNTNPERAIQLLEKAGEAYKNQGNLKAWTKALNHKAYTLYLARRLEEALRCYKQEARIKRRLRDSPGFANTLLSIADLQMELLHFQRAALVLGKALSLLPTQDLSCILMLVECEFHLGADPELLLDFLENHVEPHCHQDSPSPRSYFFDLLSKVLWDLGRKKEAREALQNAIDLKTQQADASFASHFLAYLASMQSNRREVRRILAQAQWSSRREPDFTCDQLRRWITGKPESPLPHTPYERQEAQKLRSRLGWLLGPPKEESKKDAWGEELAKALSRCAQEGPQGVLPFLRKFYGGPPLALLTLLPGGDWKPLLLKGMRLQEALSFEEGIGKRGPLAPKKTWKSHVRVASPDRGLLLCIGSKRRFFRFGPKDVRSLETFLELLQPVLRSWEGFGPPRSESPSSLAPKESRPSCPLLLGSSSAIQKLRDLTHRFASSELPLCLQGETGTGKKTLATYLHKLSTHGQGPLVFVDCASLQEGLIESELLGHVKGAFTGALKDRPGLFQQATGGSLVLVNPMALSQRGQRLLLGAIESGGFRPLGGTRVFPLNARLLCTTSKSLERGLEDGSIQADLYYRLSGMTLELPPLRNRVSDLPLLVQAMLQEERFPGPAPLPSSILAQLQMESWPGNLRELRNRVRKALILSGGERWVPRFLLPSDSNPSTRPSSEELLDLKSSLRDFERKRLLGALARFNGHRERTARALGISRRWLQKRIRDLGL